MPVHKFMWGLVMVAGLVALIVGGAKAREYWKEVGGIGVGPALLMVVMYVLGSLTGLGLVVVGWMGLRRSRRPPPP